MTTLDKIKADLRAHASPEKAKASAWFFKTGKGQYGEGDKFLGVTVPEQRAISKKYYKDISLEDTIKLLQSPWHEERLTALFILVLQYKKGEPDQKKLIASYYHKQRAWVNNWDLVDSSASYILGDYLINHSRAVLYRLAASKSVWDRRIAIISTFAFVARGELEDSIKIAELLLNDKHDLIQKAVGWVLREVGKKDKQELITFLDKHAKVMPRTMLRYSLERLSLAEKQHYMEKS